MQSGPSSLIIDFQKVSLFRFQQNRGLGKKTNKTTHILKKKEKTKQIEPESVLQTNKLFKEVLW